MAGYQQLAILPFSTFTSAQAGSGVSVALVPQNSWRLTLIAFATGPDTLARISIESTTNGFTNVLAGPTLCVGNGISLFSTYQVSWDWRDWIDTPVGAGGGEMRLNLTHLTGTSPSITLMCFLTYAS